MHCVICKTGEMKPDKASFTVQKEGAWLIFADVPAEVCNICGEAYFSYETTKELCQRAEALVNAGKAVEIRIERW